MSIDTLAARSALQRHRCYLCGCPMYKRPCNAERHQARSVEHVVPLSRGGFDGRRNKLLACVRCNGRKGDRHPYACERFYLLVINLMMDSGAYAWSKSPSGRFVFQRSTASRRLSAVPESSPSLRDEGKEGVR